MNSISVARQVDIDVIVKSMGGDGDRKRLMSLLGQIDNRELLFKIESEVNEIIADVIERAYFAGIRSVVTSK